MPILSRRAPPSTRVWGLPGSGKSLVSTGVTPPPRSSLLSWSEPAATATSRTSSTWRKRWAWWRPSSSTPTDPSQRSSSTQRLMTSPSLRAFVRWTPKTGHARAPRPHVSIRFFRECSRHRARSKEKLFFRNLFFYSVSSMGICGCENKSAGKRARADFKERRVQLPGWVLLLEFRIKFSTCTVIGGGRRR